MQAFKSLAETRLFGHGSAMERPATEYSWLARDGKQIAFETLMRSATG